MWGGKTRSLISCREHTIDKLYTWNYNGQQRDSSSPPSRGGSLPRGTIEEKGLIIHYWYAGNGIVLYEYAYAKKSTVPESLPAYSPASEPEGMREPIIVPTPSPSERRRARGLIPDCGNFSVGDAMLGLFLFFQRNGTYAGDPAFWLKRQEEHG